MSKNDNLFFYLELWFPLKKVCILTIQIVYLKKISQVQNYLILK